MHALIVETGVQAAHGTGGGQLAGFHREAPQIERLRIDPECAVVRNDLPFGTHLHAVAARLGRYVVAVLDGGSGAVRLLAHILELHRGIVENSGEVSAERPRANRTLVDDLVDVASVKARGAGPGVNLVSFRDRHFEAQAVGTFKLAGTA